MKRLALSLLSLVLAAIGVWPGAESVWYVAEEYATST